MTRISVVIPSYRNPEYLDLCLRSAFENRVYDHTQIIVVLDGYADESRHVVEKYPDLNVIEFEENKGQMVAHNTGVTLAENPWVLLVNDDNVFPRKWDSQLEALTDDERCVWAPNQIEPTPSIFKSFKLNNFGVTPAEFEYENFLKWADSYSGQVFFARAGNNPITDDGQTWPLFMSKKWYMILGGVDQNYPSAAVADWDFFLRCELAGLECQRYHGVHFYHFAGAATRKKDANWNDGEQRSFEYFAYKWGYYPRTSAINHSKIDPTLPTVRGVQFCEHNDPI